MSNVTELPTTQVRAKRSRAMIVERIKELHDSGEMTAMCAVVYTDGQSKLYVSGDMKLNELAYAVKLLDIELTALIQAGDADYDDT